jgi:acetate kinase
MSGAILVLNAGSSSIKFSLYPGHDRPNRLNRICAGECEGVGHRIHFFARRDDGTSLVDEHLPAGARHEDALAALLDWLARQFPEQRLIAAGHRVVHGGDVYKGPVRIDPAVVRQLTRLVPLAPLHQPHHLAAIAAISKLHPDLPQVACFDTSFHRTESALATTFALPRALTNQGLRRYGFHGISYEYIASLMPGILGETAAEGRVVVAHLGNGASMCAMHQRRSVATTMGFTALDGLPMGQRSGSLDPGLVLFLLQQRKMTADEVSDLLYTKSGLLGVSGISNDMRTLLESADPHAEDAIALFCYRIGRELGSLAAALGGLDALIFTAGIGEHAAEVRRRVCLGAVWLGIDLDPAANERGDRCITRSDSSASAWVISTDEDLMIAQHTFDIVGEGRVT